MTTSFLQSSLQKRWPWIVAAMGIVAWVVWMSLDGKSEPRDSRPIGTPEDIAGLRDRDDLNVLFILIDTLRADRLSMYGYERETSPTLDRLASTGVRFARHLSQSSWTKCSMASLWTSLYPTRTGVTRYDHVVPEDARMPAEVLHDAGFETFGIYRNGWVAPTFGFEQGFDVYERPAARRPNPKVRAENPTLGVVGTDEDLVAAAIEFLRVKGRRDHRWFLYLHLMDVHEYLYDEESAIFGSRYVDKYDSAIRWTDGTLSTLFAYLAEWGLSDHTLIVIGSDHGEAFRERGLEGHARAVYRETTEVPWILLFPFRLEPGVVVEARTQNVDIWPTVLDLLGLMPEGDFDGRSRVPEVIAAAQRSAPPSDSAEDHGFAYLDATWGQRRRPTRDRVAVTRGSYRYVRSEELRPDEPTKEELFDADSDPAELTNLIGDMPELANELSTEADKHLEAAPPWGEAPKRELGEMELDQLRALGYAIP